jgi:hypothetical protein
MHDKNRTCRARRPKEHNEEQSTGKIKEQETKEEVEEPGK